MEDPRMFDPTLDLLLERTVDLAPALVWRAWTQPEHLAQWFTPAPWTTVGCVMDVKPGGLFHTVMRSPTGEEFPNYGCYLELVPARMLVWTDALDAGYRPNPHAGHLPFRFTAAILIEPRGAGTHYTAVVKHADVKSRDQHDAMGFHAGWGQALTQLVAHMKTVDARG